MLECQCCGNEAATGRVHNDGDALECGCDGQIVCDEGRAWVDVEPECVACYEIRTAQEHQSCAKGGSRG